MIGVADSARWLVLLAVGLSGCGATESRRAPGAAGAPGTAGAPGAAGTPGMPSPNLAGTWIMIGFEDPLTAHLSQRGEILTGRGCDTPQVDTNFLCGDLHGSITGRNAEFECVFADSPGLGFAARVSASAEGDRMTGSFSFAAQAWSGPTTWIRASSADGALNPGASVDAVQQGLQDRERSYDLTLTAQTPDGPEFARDQIYVLQIFASRPLIIGHLGAFWTSEMTWLEAERVLRVGPVPATDPKLPIGLTLHFDAEALSEVEAVVPSGAQYVFRAREHVTP